MQDLGIFKVGTLSQQHIQKMLRQMTKHDLTQESDPSFTLYFALNQKKKIEIIKGIVTSVFDKIFWVLTVYLEWYGRTKCIFGWYGRTECFEGGMGWYSIEGGMGWYSLALFPPPQEVDQCDDGDITDLQVQTSSRLDKLAPASGPQSGHRSHRSVCLNSPVTVVLYGSIPDRVCHMSCIDNLPPAHQLWVSKTEKK